MDPMDEIKTSPDLQTEHTSTNVNKSQLFSSLEHDKLIPQVSEPSASKSGSRNTSVPGDHTFPSSKVSDKGNRPIDISSRVSFLATPIASSRPDDIHSSKGANSHSSKLQGMTSSLLSRRRPSPDQRLTLAIEQSNHVLMQEVTISPRNPLSHDTESIHHTKSSCDVVSVDRQRGAQVIRTAPPASRPRPADRSAATAVASSSRMSLSYICESGVKSLKQREANRFGSDEGNDVDSSKANRNAQEMVHSLVSKIANDPVLVAAFIRSLAVPERRTDAQVISDYINVILCDGEIHQKYDEAKIIRLLYKFVGATKAYPKRLLLREVELRKEPFAGGGFADVYEGEYKGQKVCVKQIRKFKQDEQTELLNAFIREFILWSLMSHENILPFLGVYALDETSERICLVSPFMQRGTLEAFLKKDPEIRRLPLVLGITKGLSYLHKSDIVHGDLKAQNVLISVDGRALLADFGLSYIAMTTAGASTELPSAGTTKWMAPELILGVLRIPSKMSDMWSFGCLCYEIFTRKHPFYQYTNSAQVILAVVVKNELPKRPDGNDCDEIDDWVWETMMLGCWKDLPESRQNCDQILAALAAQDVDTSSSDEDKWKQTNLAFRRDMMNQLEDKVDYARVGKILTSFLR